MLNEAIETAYLHYNRAKENYDELCNWSISLDIYNNKEQIKTIDAFLFRFIKLQDFMGDKLFKELLKKVGEYKDNMSLIDVLDKLEKLEIIEEADRWIDFRTVRNNITHEYPTNEEDIIEGIKLSLDYFKEIEKILKGISRYIKKKKLI